MKEKKEPENVKLEKNKTNFSTMSFSRKTFFETKITRTSEGVKKKDNQYGNRINKISK